jgi:lipoprotein-anchoring transpeptidase ErfK/SrfK
MNWTDGCIALDNTDVDELFSVVSLGTPVTILP